MAELFESQVILFDKYLPYIKLKADAGEISQGEYQLINIQHGRLENDMVKSKIEMNNALAELYNLTMCNDLVDVQDTSYEMLEVPLVDSNYMNNQLLGIYQAKADFNAYAVKTAKAAYFPEINLGYFSQQIDKVGGLNGFLAEAHFPLWFRPKQKSVKLAAKNYELSLNELAFASRVINNNYRNWQRKLSQYLKLYREYGQNWDSQIRDLIRNANLQLDEGEINYVEYIVLYVGAMETRVRQLELIHQINESIIQIEYYQNQ
jgi:cobalt-zinc-cadmium resistance protein CzcA